MNDTHMPMIDDRLKQATHTVAEWIRNGDISEDDLERLDTDEGLVIDGCAVWLVDGELRSYTGCTNLSCDRYSEYSVRL